MKNVLLTLILLVSATNLFGQGATGTILGTITDSSGAVVAGARVVITDVETGVSQTTVSSSNGAYAVPYLKPARYKVTVDTTGFAPTTVSDIHLVVDQSLRIDAQLRIGAVNEHVNVSGEAVTLDTDSASIGQVINERQVVDLPLNGRNFTDLMLLNAGAVQTGGEQGTRQNAGNAISLEGGRASANQYLIDGVTNNDVMYQTPALVPSIDAIQEFKSDNKNYSAEYGTSANQINISIKSGTNQLHGTAYDFLRNNFFDARGYFDANVPVLRQNQFGYSLGGPVYIPKVYKGRNRTFFFANFEEQKTVQFGTAYSTVPTASALAGQFTTPIQDPLAPGTYFPNNQVPASRISHFAQVMEKYYPAPNTSSPLGNYITTVDSPIQAYQQNYRIDHTFSAKDTVFGRYSRAEDTYTNGGVIPEQGYVYPQNTWSYQLTWIHSFSATIINQFRWGQLNAAADQLGAPVAQSVLNSLNLQGVYSSTPYPALPNVGVTGLLGPGGPVNVPWVNDQPTKDVSDSLSFNRGAHSITVGADMRWWQLKNNTTTGFYGQWSFTGDFSGSPLADFLLGNPTSVWATQPTAYSSPSNPGSPVDVHYSAIAPFIQDNWKVTPSLTLNVGLRYDWSSVPYEQKNHWSWFDPNIAGGGLCVADKSLISSGLGDGLYAYCGSRTAGPSQKMVFAPRFGFAWRPFPNNKTVVRGGYGIFYDTAEAFEDIGSGNIYPYTIRSSYNAVPGVNLLSADQLFPNLATPGPVQVADLSFYEPQAQHRYDPYVQEWSFSIERELPWSSKLDIEYVGSKGTHLDTRRSSNQPYAYDPNNPSTPQSRLPYQNFQTIVETFWESNSNYNALNVKYERNLGGLALVAAYTWGKSMDDKSAAAAVTGDAAGWAGPMDSHNQRLDYAPSTYDATQRFVASFVYQIPVGRSQKFLGNASRPVDLLIGNWQINGIALFQSGFPYSVAALDLNNYNEANGQRADIIGKPYPAGFQQSIYEWFNTAAFAEPALGIYGNSGRNILRAPGVSNWDISLFKNIPFSEHIHLQLRLESFNAFNHTQFNGPDQNLQDPTFGVIGSARPARINQLAAKWVW